MTRIIVIYADFDAQKYQILFYPKNLRHQRSIKCQIVLSLVIIEVILFAHSRQQISKKNSTHTIACTAHSSPTIPDDCRALKFCHLLLPEFHLS